MRSFPVVETPIRLTHQIPRVKTPVWLAKAKRPSDANASG